MKTYLIAALALLGLCVADAQTPTYLPANGATSKGTGVNNVVTFPGIVQSGIANSGAASASSIGDSLTQGASAGTTAQGPGLPYPTLLSQQIGQPVNNLGFCGQNLQQMAIRLGAENSSITLAGNQIPTSGSVGITFSPLPDPSSGCSGGKAIAVTIYGVPGNITNSSGTQNASVFTPTTYPTSPVTVPANTTWTQAGCSNTQACPVLGTMLNGLNIIWGGRNDIYGGHTAASLVQHIQNIINILPSPKQYVVLSITKGDVPAEYPGGSGQIEIDNDNAAFQAAFPNNYLDVETPLVNGYATSGVWAAQDAIDFGHNIPPASLRSMGSVSLTADITSTTQTAIQLSSCVYGTLLPGISFGGPYTGERMEIVSCDTGTNIATVTRGYAGSTPSTYTAGSMIYLDREHLDVGYQTVETTVYKWMQTHLTNYLPLTNLYEMFANQQYPSTLLKFGGNTTCPILHDDMNTHTSWPWCGETGSGATNVPTFGLSYYVWNAALGNANNVLQLAIQYDGSSAWFRVDTNGTWGGWIQFTTNGLTLNGLGAIGTVPTDLNAQVRWPWAGLTNTSTSNMPQAGLQYICSNTGIGFANYVQQFCTGVDTNALSYIRNNVNGVWSAWQPITYNGLTFQGKTANGTVPTDLNTMTSVPWWGAATNGVTSNIPNAQNFICANLGVGSASGNVLQLCQGADTSIYARLETSGTWGGWAQFERRMVGNSAAWNNGGSAIAANSCVAGPTAAITGVSTSMSLTVTPAADPGTGLIIGKAINTSGTTVQAWVCNITAAGVTPTSTTYTFRALQ